MKCFILFTFNENLHFYLEVITVYNRAESGKLCRITPKHSYMIYNRMKSGRLWRVTPYLGAITLGEGGSF